MPRSCPLTCALVALALGGCRDASSLAPAGAGARASTATSADDVRFALAPLPVGTSCTLTSQLSVAETPPGRVPNLDLQVEQTVDVLEVGAEAPALPTRLRTTFGKVLQDGEVVRSLPPTAAYDVHLVKDQVQVTRFATPIAVGERDMFQRVFIPLITVFERMVVGRGWRVGVAQDVELAPGPPEIRGRATLRELTAERATIELAGANHVGAAATSYTGSVTIDRRSGLAIEATLSSRSTGNPGGVASVLEQRQHQTKSCAPP